MDNALLSLTHEQQQEAVEAIQIVANQLREKYQQNQLDQTEKTK